jgi:hypothetical protein
MGLLGQPHPGTSFPHAFGGNPEKAWMPAFADMTGVYWAPFQKALSFDILRFAFLRFTVSSFKFHSTPDSAIFLSSLNHMSTGMAD